MRKMLIIPAVMLAAAFGAVAEERTLEHPGAGASNITKATTGRKTRQATR